MSKSDLEGYVTPFSVLPGAKIQLRVHAPNKRTFGVVFSRMTAPYTEMYQAPNNPNSRLQLLDQVVGYIRNVDPTAQDYPDPYPQSDAYMTGANWSVSCEWEVPQYCRSGVYTAELADDHSTYYGFSARFIVRNPHPRVGSIGVLVPTNTWQAYNDWGGRSYYFTCDNSPITKYTVSYERPLSNAGAGHLARGDRFILGWLDAHGYDYSVLCDLDLDKEGLNAIAPFDTLIIGTHSEYWSAKMYDALVEFLKTGSVMCLGGNAIYAEVEIVNNTQMRTPDPNYYKWTELNRPAARVLGVHWSENMLWPVPGATPYLIRNEDHPFLKGTSLRNGERVGQRGLNNEHVDSPNPHCPSDCLTGAAAGWEMDWRDPAVSPVPDDGIIASAESTGKPVYHEDPNGNCVDIGNWFGGDMTF